MQTEEGLRPREETLNQALNDLQTDSSDIEACAVVSEDGLILAGSLPKWAEENHVAAISGAMFSMGNRTTAELKLGMLKRLMVEGENGNFIIINAGPHAVLMSIVHKNAKLGLIFFDLSKAAMKIEEILS